MASDKYPKYQIPDNDSVLRRVNVSQLVKDAEGNLRPTRSSLNTSSADRSSGRPGTSVDWKELIIQDGLDPIVRHASKYGNYCLVELSVSKIRSNGHEVEHDPLSDIEDDNPYHSQIYPGAGKAKLTEGQTNVLSKSCKIVFQPKS